MTTWLLLRDPVWRTMRMLFPVALFLGFVLRFLTQGIPGGIRLGTPLAIIMWNLFVLQQKEGQAGARALTGTTHLPIPARQLWLARIMAMSLAAALLPLTAAAVAYATAGGPAKPDLFEAALLLTACELLAIAVIQSFCPQLLSAGLSGMPALSYGLGHIVGLGLLFGLAGRGVEWVALPAGLAALIVLRTWRRIPPAFLSSPDEPLAERSRRQVRLPALPVALQVGRLATGWPTVLIALLVMVCALLPAQNWPMPMAVMLMAFIAPLGLLMMLNRLHLVSYLPVSRRMLFAWATMPTSIAALGGLVLNPLVWGVRPPPDDISPSVLGFGSVAIWTGMMVMIMVKMQRPPRTRAGRRWQLALLFILKVMMLGFWAVLYIVAEEPGAIGQMAWASSIREAVNNLIVSVPDSPILGVLVTAVALALSYRLLERWFEHADLLFEARST